MSNTKLPSILIVDDEPKNIQLLGNILQEYYTIEFAINGEVALEWVDTEHFDLILLDIMMPTLDGFEVCKILKENPKTKDIPIIFLTAKTDTQSIVKGFQIGAVDYITKPFHQEELLVRVRNHLSSVSQKKLIQEYNGILEKKNIELRELIASKDKFFSIIAHDLKGPISSLKGLSNLLIREYTEIKNSQLLSDLKIIQNTSNEIYELLENLLLWSRSQSRVIEVYNEKFEIRQLLEKILKLLNGKAIEKNIYMENLVSESTQVYADINLTDTILRNLLSNALKFTPKSGKVKVEDRRNENFLYLSVMDTGIGIEEDYIPNIFSIDSKYQRKGTEKESGTGLGLILCKEFVEMMNGKIFVKSKVGVGSTFTFSLPLA